jgi:DNA-binding NtrC family response regulator
MPPFRACFGAVCQYEQARELFFSHRTVSPASVSTSLRPLVVIADSAGLTRWALERAFASAGYETCAVPDCEQLLKQLMRPRDCIVVSASRFDAEDVMPILRRVARARPEMRVIALGAPDDGVAAADDSANFVIVEQPFSVADVLRIATSVAAPVRAR